MPLAAQQLVKDQLLALTACQLGKKKTQRVHFSNISSCNEPTFFLLDLPFVSCLNKLCSNNFFNHPEVIWFSFNSHIISQNITFPSVRTACTITVSSWVGDLIDGGLDLTVQSFCFFFWPYYILNTGLVNLCGYESGESQTERSSSNSSPAFKWPEIFFFTWQSMLSFIFLKAFKDFHHSLTDVVVFDIAFIPFLYSNM